MSGARPAAFGGEGFAGRVTSLREELGGLWADCGIDSEVGKLEAVLLHRPGPEIQVADPNRALMLAEVDWRRARAQHDQLAETYRSLGIDVHLIDPKQAVSPNQVFVADLFWMTPEGALLGRPASVQRAGEERPVARRLADLGVPILRSIRGRGVFEGADALWLDEGNVLFGQGPRSNQEGERQVAALLADLGVELHSSRQPEGCMHLMGQLRFVNRSTAVAWKGRLPDQTVALLEGFGYRVEWLEDREELTRKMALNFVTVASNELVVPADCPRSHKTLEGLGAICHPVEVDELAKAAGGIACMSGVLRRQSL